MEIETLARVAAIGFRVSIVVFLIGVVLTALTFWKMNIREIYMIRSGKAKRRTIGQLEAHNRETGKLRDTLDLDYTSDSLKKPSKKLSKKPEKSTSETPFTPETHSGNTGAFQKSSTDNSYASVTVQLDRPADSYEARMDAVYEKPVTGDLAKPEPATAAAPLTILSHELIIHTDEIIEI